MFALLFVGFNNFKLSLGVGEAAGSDLGSVRKVEIPEITSGECLILGRTPIEWDHPPLPGRYTLETGEINICSTWNYLDRGDMLGTFDKDLESMPDFFMGDLNELAGIPQLTHHTFHTIVFDANTAYCAIQSWNNFFAQIKSFMTDHGILGIPIEDVRDCPIFRLETEFDARKEHIKLIKEIYGYDVSIYSGMFIPELIPE